MMIMPSKSLFKSLLPILISYLLMIGAQTYGTTIIQFLHGSDYAAALLEASSAHQSTNNKTRTKFVVPVDNEELSNSDSTSISRMKKLFNNIFIKRRIKRKRNQQKQTHQTELLTFCEEYEAAHFNKVSDILHVSGMISLLLILWLLIVIPYLHLQEKQQQMTTRSRSTRSTKTESSSSSSSPNNNNNNNNNNNSYYLKICLNLLFWIPPIYYIPAWIGHFIFQKDIPAVFTYGQTWDGWKKGETCAFKQLLQGRMLSYPHEYGIAITLSVLMVILVLFQSIQHNIPWYDDDDDDDDDIDNGVTATTKTTSILSEEEKKNR